MIKRYFLRISLVAFIVPVTFAIYHISAKMPQAEMVAASHECHCGSQGLDPYEKPMKYIYGKHVGQCIDSCKHRYIEILKADPDAEYVEISNLFHDNKFWKARVPTNKVERVEVFFENFRKSFNHVALQFYFEEGHPVELELQDKSLEGPKTFSTTSLIVSPEGIPPKGKEYNLYDGMMGHMALMYRVYSAEQYDYFQSTLGYPLRFYKAKLAEKEMNRLLAISLRKSADGTNGVYQLVFNNCATSSMDLILDSKHQLLSESWDRWDILDPLRGIPLSQRLGTLDSLEWWDLIDTADSRVVTPKGLKFPNH